MGGTRKRHLHFIALSLLASSVVTFVPLHGENSKAALAQTKPTIDSGLTINDNPITENQINSVDNKQPEKRYAVYQLKENQQVLLNHFQNLNDAILLAKGTQNTKVMDEVSHTVLWDNTLPSGSLPNKTFVQPPKPGANPTFDDALAFTLGWEGGYSNNPNDHGGSTYKGITQTEYTSYRMAKGLPDQDVRNMADGELREIYYNGYWLPVHGNDMPYPIAVALFDGGVNCGPGTAIEFLENSLGMAQGVGWSQIKQALTTSSGASEIALKIMDYRDEYYKNIVNNDASQLEFLQGWLNRENALTYKLSQWILQNHFYLDEAKYFLDKKNIYNAAYYTVQAVKNNIISAQNAVSLGDGLALNDRLAFYQNLESADTTPEIKLELKNRYLDLAKSYFPQKDFNHAASYALKAFLLGSSAQEVFNLGNSLANSDQTSYWMAIIHSGQDVPPAIDAEFMKRQSIPVTGITLNNKSLHMTMQGKPLTLGAVLSPTNATDQKLSWKSDNENVVKVDAHGVLTPVGTGSATITVTTDDGSKTDTCSITVVPSSSVPTASVPSNQTNVYLTIGGPSQKLNVSSLSDQKINWTIDQPNIVAVDSDGVITPVGVGSALITATSTSSGKAVTYHVTVVDPNNN